MKRYTGAAFVLALFALLTFGSPCASADTFGFDIGIPNAAMSPYTAPYASVNINLTSATTATVTFTSETATSGNPNCTPANPCTYLMGDGSSVALNIAASSFTVGSISAPASFVLDGNTFTPGPYTVDNPPGTTNVSDFGRFNMTIDDFDGFAHSTNSLSFVVTNTGGTWANAMTVVTANAKGFYGAAHIFVESGLCTGACVTGFAGNGVVPEPGSIAMFGTGLLVAGYTLRRKLLRR